MKKEYENRPVRRRPLELSGKAQKMVVGGASIEVALTPVSAKEEKVGKDFLAW